MPADAASVCLAGFLFLLSVPTALAGAPEILAARGDCNAKHCTLSVTLRHADSGWEHYADHWRVLDDRGRELGRRVLAHPHVDEQPFTRSLTLTLPPATRSVWIEAHDSVHGYGETGFKLELPPRQP